MKKAGLILLLGLLIWGCQPNNYPQPTLVTPYSAKISSIPAQTNSSNSLNIKPSPTDTFDPSSTTQITSSRSSASITDQPNWMSLPVIPYITPNSVQIFQRGQKLGNHPNAFSKVGDCGSTPAWFLGDFDRGPRYYNLGHYTYLQEVIDHYHGSFNRISLAALAGYNTASVLTPLWSDKKHCGMDESPLECEYRVQKPAIALITLGANDVFHLDSFEVQMRKVIETTIQHGIIPVLATKPDNVEGDHKINRIIVSLATEYDIPLWNYWLAVQTLPNHGLQEDGVHITFASNDFSNPLNLEAGWPIRNLTALQVLDQLYKVLKP